jgi:hypothetical protein
MSDLNNNEKVFNLLNESGTNWSANKIPLMAFNESEGMLSTESFGMFNSVNNQWLGTVGTQYTAMQNSDLAEIIVELQEVFGGDIQGGTLQDGKRIYYQNTLADEHINNDTLKRNITCLNSHNGSSAIGFGSTNTVISCANTFHMALRDLKKFRHTANSSERLKLAVADFKLAMSSDQHLMDTFKRMADVKIDKPIIGEMISNLFGVNPSDTVKDISTRKINQLNRFNEALSSEIAEKGQTIWGLFNGVTYYTNHLEVSDKHKDHIMIGGGYKKNLKAYDLLSEYTISKKPLVHSMS